MRRFYTLLLYAGLPVILMRLWWRGRRNPDYRRRWRERFGLIEPLPSPGALWVHAVSVGEARAALPLVRALTARYPDRPILVTTTTPTGSRQVREALGHVHHVYLPYDLPGSVKRFLARTRPALGVIMETELWPNLYTLCHRQGMPLVVANARLSERSARGYGRLKGLTRRTLECTAMIAAQGEEDARRFRALGAERVQLAGNLKYDLTPPPDLEVRGEALREALGAERPVLLAASTHKGEEAQVLEAFLELRRQRPDWLLVVVPRHPERFNEVAGLCRAQGLEVVRRSDNRAVAPGEAVMVGDSMGELLLFYAAADIAFVGGSLVPVGGHNVLEPALLGKPVLFGPHMFNFSDIAQRLLESGAARRVKDPKSLAWVVMELHKQPPKRRIMGEHGREVVAANRGALAVHLAIIEKLLERAPSDPAAGPRPAAPPGPAGS